MDARACAVALVLSTIAVGLDEAAAQTSAGATVTVAFAPRSTVTASSPVLLFDVRDPAMPAMATLDFVAAARTASGGEVRLIAELGACGPGAGECASETRRGMGPRAHETDGLSGAAGPAGPEARIALEGGPDGTVAGELDPAGPALAARWTGSGRRTGRLMFSLRASSPGTYAIPVKLSVSVR
jgi:hypothetical protein